jgi:hypothetical protein
VGSRIDRVSPELLLKVVSLHAGDQAAGCRPQPMSLPSILTMPKDADSKSCGWKRSAT